MEQSIQTRVLMLFDQTLSMYKLCGSPGIIIYDDLSSPFLPNSSLKILKYWDNQDK